MPRIPDELARAAAVVTRDVNSDRPGLVAGILAVLITVGFGAEWLIRRALKRVQKGNVAQNAGQAEVAALLTFTLASAGSFMVFEWPPLLQRIVLTLLLALIVFRVVRATAKLLFFNSGGAASTDQTPAHS